jgi:hypothetical protein
MAPVPPGAAFRPELTPGVLTSWPPNTGGFRRVDPYRGEGKTINATPWVSVARRVRYHYATPREFLRDKP